MVKKASKGGKMFFFAIICEYMGSIFSVTLKVSSLSNIQENGKNSCFWSKKVPKI
jgi:hypothetical protein